MVSHENVIDIKSHLGVVGSKFIIKNIPFKVLSRFLCSDVLKM